MTEEFTVVENTKDYDLIVAPSDNGRLYRVVNRKYNVVEFEHYVLANVIFELHRLQANLDNINELKHKILPDPIPSLDNLQIH